MPAGDIRRGAECACRFTINIPEFDTSKIAKDIASTQEKSPLISIG
jgi:hypothetical protein